MRMAGKKGFTLIELLVVATLILFLLSLSASSLEKLQADQKVVAAGMTFKIASQMCQIAGDNHRTKSALLLNRPIAGQFLLAADEYPSNTNSPDTPSNRACQLVFGGGYGDITAYSGGGTGIPEDPDGLVPKAYLLRRFDLPQGVLIKRYSNYYNNQEMPEAKYQAYGINHMGSACAGASYPWSGYRFRILNADTGYYIVIKGDGGNASGQMELYTVMMNGATEVFTAF